MTIVSSIKANSFERRYTFASDGLVVSITVPLQWDEKSPEWVKNRCKQGLVCTVMFGPPASPRTIRLKQVVVNDSGKLSDLDWNEVQSVLTGELALDSLISAFSGASKASPSAYSKVFNKKVLDKKTPSVV